MNIELVCSIALFVIICLFVICCWIMIWDSNRFVETRVTIESDKIKKELNMVFISDLHNKEYGLHNADLLKAIDDIQPDFVLIGGDILTAKPKASFEKAADFIQHLAQKYQIYYALGNHEYRAEMHTDTYGTLYADYKKAISSENIVFLDNSHVFLKEYGVSISGLSIEKKYYKRFIKREMDEGYLLSAIGQPNAAYFQILLAHNPEYFKDYSSWTSDLILSGHIHGGVARLPFLGGMISPSLHPFPHYDGGMFEEYGSRMFLSRGLGMHTIPVRFLNPGELVVLELKPAKNPEKSSGTTRESQSNHNQDITQDITKEEKHETAGDTTAAVSAGRSFRT